MPFQWSENAVHIQSLYRPWNVGDGYAEDVVAAAEARLGVRFPALLRHFYRSWGTRHDLTRTNQTLLSPHEVWLQSDALIVCVENQAVWYWAIPCTSLHQDDPPVQVARNEEPNLIWLPSHDRLSHFLDYLTYAHALDGGAIHGAYSREWIDDKKLALLHQHWKEKVLPSYPAGLIPDGKWRTWSLFIGDTYVINGLLMVAVASRTSEILDDIGHVLDVHWEHRW